MEEKDYIKFCRSYKGEDSDSSDRQIQAIIAQERWWVKHSVVGDIRWALDDYLAYGMREFEQFDDTPATLKAFLFNRYCSERIDIDGFKKWYKNVYMK